MYLRMKMSVRILFCICLFCLALTAIHGAVFYVDPATGDIGNDGSSGSPWSTLEEVFDNNLIESRSYSGGSYPAKNAGAPVTGGDTIMLRSGYHGRILDHGYFNTDYITVMAQPGHRPVLSHILFDGLCAWIFQGLTITAESGASYSDSTLFDLDTDGYWGPASDVTIRACTLYSVDDMSGWNDMDWDTLAASGISFDGDNLTALNCYIRNVNFGISSSGDSALIESCVIENFAADGMRGLGDYSVYQYNTIKNCYDVNTNHDDAFQSYSVGTGWVVGADTVHGVIFRGNTIINYEDEAQPYRGALQGMGNFDGMFEGWRIENNLIITDHWHGISLYGALNCTIINNTILDPNQVSPGPPWIGVFDHKDGYHSENSIIRNNLATDIETNPYGTTDHNITLSYSSYDNYFTDFSSYDCSLIADCAAQDAGTTACAPTEDKTGFSRLSGGLPDIGAYEYDQGDLPVELASFSAVRQGDDILLSWITVTEQDNLGFNILSAPEPDGPFARVNTALVPGHGTSVQTNQYSWEDTDAADGDVYYRLEQVDIDGSRHLSGVITVPEGPAAIQERPSASAALPVPRDALRIRFTCSEPGNFAPSLWKADGTPVYTWPGRYYSAGWHYIILQERPETGVYVLKAGDEIRHLVVTGE